MPEPVDKPVPAKELDKHFKPRGALKKTPIALERRFHVAADREPQINTRLERVDRGDGQRYWEVIVDIDGVSAGGRALPPALKGRATQGREAPDQRGATGAAANRLRSRSSRL